MEKLIELKEMDGNNEKQVVIWSDMQFMIQSYILRLQSIQKIRTATTATATATATATTTLKQLNRNNGGLKS